MEKGKKGGGSVLGELSLDEEGSSNSPTVPPKVCLERTDDSGSQFLFCCLCSLLPKDPGLSGGGGMGGAQV